MAEDTIVGDIGFLWHPTDANGRVLTANENAVEKASRNLADREMPASRDISKAFEAIARAKALDRQIERELDDSETTGGFDFLL